MSETLEFDALSDRRLQEWRDAWKRNRPRKAFLINNRLRVMGSYDVHHGTTHAYPDSTDGLVDGCTVFRNGRLWFWSSARHMWMTKRVAA
ncbi:hypothetical protein [Williamsia serinedens]|uniref:Uncharacterized protein n=1 Tax=Williamsia serinedens TaxID=391736 RepID=A0ABT1H7D6_9NOCA|nr:hypothetical protein [Williamsia serinedens]MCP2163146.1 hypothetical protein [Williamsia serinedens]